MGLESGTYISELNTSNPLGTDVKSQGDDHLRLIKTVLKATLPNATRAFRFPNTVASQTATYAVVANVADNLYIPCNAAGGAFDVDLPAVPAIDGLSVVVVKTDSTFNAVTIDGNGNNVNGAASITLTRQYEFAILTWFATAGVWYAERGPTARGFQTTTNSANYTVTYSDELTFFQGDSTSASFTYTLLSAVSAGEGFTLGFSNAGTANVVKVLTVSSQEIKQGATNYLTQIALLPGESIILVSDGTNWRIISRVGDIIQSRGIIPVEDRVTAAPGAPIDGGYYLVSGAYASYSVGDILFYTGVTYVLFRPATDCGWMAYVKDENTRYNFEDTAWVVEGTAIIATITAENYVESIRLGTKVTEVLNLGQTTKGDVDGNVLVGMITSVNTENYYLRAIYRPLQMQQNGSWTTVSVV